MVRKEIPTRVVDEDAETFAFEDIQPQAPAHVLVVPKKHIATLNDIGAEDEALVGKLFRTAGRIAKTRGFAEPGWRAVLNCNRDANQTVFHIHLHVLAGRKMHWPPG
jgi:histidine triad (HIT) family protein